MAQVPGDEPVASMMVTQEDRDGSALDSELVQLWPMQD